MSAPCSFILIPRLIGSSWPGSPVVERIVARNLCAIHHSRAPGKKTWFEFMAWNRWFASLRLKMGIMSSLAEPLLLDKEVL